MTSDALEGVSIIITINKNRLGSNRKGEKLSRTAFGGGRSTGFALIYDTMGYAHKFEPKHRILRHGIGKKDESAHKQRKEKKNIPKKLSGTAKTKGKRARKTE